MSENPESQGQSSSDTAGPTAPPTPEGSQASELEAQPIRASWLRRFNGWLAGNEPVTNFSVAVCALVGLAVLVWQSCETRRSTNAALASLEFGKEEAKSGEADTKVALQAANRSAKAAEDAANAMRESVTIWQRQADVAERSFRTTERSIRDRERAWVAFEGLTQQPQTWNVGDEFTLRLQVKNVGALPAIRVVVQSTTLELTGMPLVVDWTKLQWKSVATLGANMSIAQEVPIYKLSTQRVESIKAGRLNLYALSHVTYSDQLGHPHETKFCQYLDPEKKTWGYCNGHNDIN